MTTTPIRLRDAAKFYRDMEHQRDAFDWLETQLRPAQLEEFAILYRAGPSAGAAPDDSSAIELVAPMIRHFEGLELKAYPDPLSGGDPITIGIGTTRYPDGNAVRMGDVITEVQAWEYMKWYAAQCEESQRNRIPTWDRMNTAQQAALIGFAFNLGSNWFGSQGFNTLTRNVGEMDWAAVPQTLLLYVNPGTNVTAGLRRRREAEGQLFSTGKWSPPS
jgi:GH24 family phage-related lysozyme (muramidase)